MRLRLDTWQDFFLLLNNKKERPYFQKCSHSSSYFHRRDRGTFVGGRKTEGKKEGRKERRQERRKGAREEEKEYRKEDGGGFWNGIEVRKRRKEKRKQKQKQKRARKSERGRK